MSPKRLRERARICADVRRFFDAQGFVEVQTPVMVPSPGLDVHLDAFEVQGGDRGSPRWLSTSPEYQMKRLLAAGLPRIYQLAPCFRRGESGERHNPEFTMLEWYRAEAGVDDVMADTERLVSTITSAAVQLGGRRVDLSPPFDRVTVAEAFASFAGWSTEETLAAAADDEDLYFRTLVERVEPGIAASDRGVFLTDFPATQASLARRRPSDARFAERFELYVAGVELCNGFGELVDPAEQRARLLADQATRRARDLPVYPIDERFLDALASVPPSGGNALGLDRLVALACGSTDIAVAMSFTSGEL
jgi:elongation factor P--(R)-beta-lysine ligase